MADKPPIDVVAEPSQAVVVRESLPVEEVHKPIATTPAQAKVDAIASLTMAAYQKAASLALTPEETAALQADFPDDAFQPGAAGKEHLLYIEHAHLRDRFTKVFGMGQWAIIPRNRWAEPFKTAKGDDGSRVYVEAMLVVRGCFVGEAIGAMEYYPHNASQNYGDAVEGAKTAAFRRCAKEFGVGLQAWKKDWCEGWWKRHWAAKKKPAPNPPTVSTSQAVSSASTPKQEKPQASPPTQEKAVSAPTNGNVKCATLQQKVKLLEALAPQKELAERYMKAIDWLFPTEPIEKLELAYVPVTKKQFDLLMERLEACKNGEPAVAPYPPNPTPDPPTKPKAEKPAEPAPEPPKIDPAWLVAEGVIETVNLKEGKKKDGTGWSLWGIKLGGEWHNSFSNRIGHFARDAYHSKQPVKLYYTLDKENRREAQEIL